jgi:hypothetical protein
MTTPATAQPITVPVPTGATFSPTDDNGSEQAKPLPPFDPKVAGRYTTEANYPQWARTQPKIGPDSKPGEYEAWSGVQSGTNKDQAIDALKDTGAAALETAGGIAGATGVGALAEALPSALPNVLVHTTAGIKAITAWADAHPFQAWTLFNVMKEMIPRSEESCGNHQGCANRRLAQEGVDGCEGERDEDDADEGLAALLGLLHQYESRCDEQFEECHKFLPRRVSPARSKLSWVLRS